MPTYASELDSRHYIGNVILRMLGEYFSIRTPDSGLAVLPEYSGLVKSVVINPTQIDLRRVSSTISSFSFKLVDQNRAVTALIEGDASSFLDTEVEIWVGRSDVGMDFGDYFKLPTTRIKKIDYADGEYSFSTQEQTERLNRAIFQDATTLDVDILAGTTNIDAASVSDFADSGFIKIDNEIISYTGRDLAEKRFTGCIRGEYGTTPAAHSNGAAIYGLEVVEGNPVDIALKVLISGGGGGAYDVLGDGCGLSEGLVDISGMLALRDAEFSGVNFRAFLYQISALRWLEEEILTPLSLRFSTSDDSKLTLKQTDRIAIRPPGTEITNSTIKGSPKWSVDASRIVNRIEVEWDYSEALGKYQQTSSFVDSESVTKYGEKDKLSFKFKTLRAALDGASQVERFAARMLRRLSTPSPEVNLTTHIDKSIFGPVDRVRVVTDQLPDYDGTLDFASDLEVVSRAINYLNGDVNFRLAWVTNTLHNLGFIAPSDLILSQPAPNRLTLQAGRGAYYVKGWRLRLWGVSPHAPCLDPVNTITAIEGDTLVFENPWATSVNASSYRLRFADYPDVSEDQKRFAFVSIQASNFADGKLPYKVTFSA